ncbi:PspC domain-containing protein [Clostridium beijerinckii]|uniref:DNA-binding transcriptional activator PspC n=2 Tax=Clostridium TaxID=1485 RepID=A0A1S8S6Y9_CLOBE|nr:PspC domain-containing protein [Clostridium beijerinckii]MBA8933237.1 phage shock protein PspC (stress-responsive transcriptional regulator) [Clostridium beijerinckii]NMF04173.1 PspC domain-containing protein [Clostridium beijerinckii]NOW05804.1 phage shock protein PspC (stress-responsive transcriptional regulator) [Clostridium beijerinckii]NRT73465.1 phage shock protein PspC (stress-responsive transcriptional regulator) [Clostridium beijerinckii]NRT91653.1 phage shock protein PspC (stress-
MEKRLYLSATDKKLAGVCGGIAEYFGLDSTLVRIGWAILIVCAGSGLLLYIICALIIPKRPL